MVVTGEWIIKPRHMIGVKHQWWCKEGEIQKIQQRQSQNNVGALSIKNLNAYHVQ